MRPHGYIRVTAVGVPVTVAGLRVEPGDLLHADKHGVLSVPREGAPKLPSIAEQIRIEESETIAWVRSPAFSIELCSAVNARPRRGGPLTAEGS